MKLSQGVVDKIQNEVTTRRQRINAVLGVGIGSFIGWLIAPEEDQIAVAALGAAVGGVVGVAATSQK